VSIDRQNDSGRTAITPGHDPSGSEMIPAFLWPGEVVDSSIIAMKEVRISQVDALFSNGIYPIEFLFYYKDGFKTERLRRTLRKLSSAFWPMFGEYRDGLIVFDKYREVDCFDEEVVHHELNIADLKENGFEVCSRFRLPDLKRLFFMKVLRLNKGMALIPKLSHLAGDGYSYFYFLSLLAALSQPTLALLKPSLMSLFLKPHHRRTALKDFSFKGAELRPVLQADKFAIELVEISRGDVQSLIKETAASDNLRISTNDVLSAMALKKLVGLESGYGGEEVELTIPIDVRRQIKEYGRGFFGNGLMLHNIRLKQEHIENSPAKDIAASIRKSMPYVSRETYIDYLAGLENIISEREMEKLRPFDPGRGCLVTNLSKLPSDKLDFGTGCPELVVPLSVEKNSTAILANKENFVLRFAY
jgi:hypothetical protein